MEVNNGNSWDSYDSENLSNTCSSCDTSLDKISELENRIAELEQNEDLHRRVNGELREAYTKQSERLEVTRTSLISANKRIGSIVDSYNKLSDSYDLYRQLCIKRGGHFLSLPS